MRRPQFFQHAASIGLAVLIVAGLTARARAQHTPDPYNIVGDGNAAFEDFMYSSYPNAAGFNSNQGILQGRAGGGRANQFQNYLDGLDGGGSSLESMFGSRSRGRNGLGTPYYRAHHQFDEAFERVYIPNAASEETFRADQEARTKLYLEYLKESDPKKRAQLYRAYNQQSLRVARDSSAGSMRAAARNRESSATSSAPPPSASRASLFRRPAGPQSALSRTRTTPAPRTSETPEEILDRATRLPQSVPRSPSGSPAPPR